MIGLAKDVGDAAQAGKDGGGFRRDRSLVADRFVAEEVFRAAGIPLRGFVGVGDEIGDGRGDAGEVAAAGVIRLCRVGGCEFAAEAVGQFCGVAIGDEDILQCLKLLVLEGEQGGLGELAGLDGAGDGEIRVEGGLAGWGAEQGGDRGQSAQSVEIGGGLCVAGCWCGEEEAEQGNLVSHDP